MSRLAPKTAATTPKPKLIFCDDSGMIIKRNHRQTGNRQHDIGMIFVSSLGVYFLTGLVFAIAFFLVGYKLILADAAGSKLRVRLLWFPGAVAIWPLLVFKWLNRDPKEDARADEKAEQ